MELTGTVAAAWIPTRDEALRRLADFIPRAGRKYRSERNYDRGPQNRENISTLSPYIRHRTITEVEVLEHVLAQHTPNDAFKFIQEVFWRTYWKGWLEAHPAAWRRYREALDERYALLEREPDVSKKYHDAVAGRTGIDAFDAWAKELVEIGYLHNHARMWFASTWIFTLGLPWELGADFFMQNLLDGDPASNTLSWRWVAGLHTKGKTYRATRDNIRRYTENRFDPGSALATTTPALVEPPIPAVLNSSRERDETAAAKDRALLVLHEEDLGVETLEVQKRPFGAVCVLFAPDKRSPRGVAQHVRKFTRGLANDAIERAARHFDAGDAGTIDATDPYLAGSEIVRLANQRNVTHIVTPFAPVGPVRDALRIIEPQIREKLDGYAETARRYDTISYPYATRGFYNLGTHIPDILRELRLTSG